jgi:hypothetical protein
MTAQIAFDPEAAFSGGRVGRPGRRGRMKGGWRKCTVEKKSFQTFQTFQSLLTALEKLGQCGGMKYGQARGETRGTGVARSSGQCTSTPLTLTLSPKGRGETLVMADDGGIAERKGCAKARFYETNPIAKMSVATSKRGLRQTGQTQDIEPTLDAAAMDWHETNSTRSRA